MRLLLALVVLLFAAVPAASARTVEIGTAINNQGFDGGGQAYRDALLRHDAFSAESAMKMLELQPTRGRYRLRAADPTSAGAYRDYTGGGGVVVVDRIPPNAPLLVTDRVPAWEGWYRDGVEVRFADGGDAVLPDGSPGSGLNPTSVPAPRVISTTGTTVVSGAGKDRAGNASPSVSGTYRVDADAPVASAATGGYEPGTWTSSDVTVTFACSDAGAGLAGAAPPAAVVSSEGAGQLRTGDCVDRVGHVTTATSGAISIDKSPPAGTLTCPSPVTVGSSASGSWTASDALSGLAGESSGTIPLDTARAGTFTASHEVRDLVGHTATLSCTYRVDEPAAATATPTSTSTSAASSTGNADPDVGALARAPVDGLRAAARHPPGAPPACPERAGAARARVQRRGVRRAAQPQREPVAALRPRSRRAGDARDAADPP